MAREYFLAYHSYSEFIAELSDAEVGRLFRACLEYSKSGATERLSGAEKYVFPAMRFQIDRDKETYDKKVTSSKENGAKGGRPKPKGFENNPNNPEVFLETQITQGFPEEPKKPKEKEKEKVKENEKEKEKENVLSVSLSPTAGEFEQIISAWNSIPDLASIEKIEKASQRGKAVSARLKEYGLEKVLEAIELVKQSDFLLGKKESRDGRNWRCSFDWLMSPSNFQKVIENTYTDHKPEPTSGALGALDEHMIEAARRALYRTDEFGGQI